MPCRFAAAVFLAALAAPARAEVRDAAELFPADTLAYLELARPADTAAALAALLKHSPFADSVTFTQDRLDKVPDAQKAPPVLRAARAGLLGAPEVLAELKRIRGAAVALTGFSPAGEPRVAAAVLLGDSPLFGLAARAFLTTTPDLRRVAVADGIPVFQFRAFVGPLTTPEGKPFAPGDEDNPLRGHQLKPGPCEPTFAYAPGLFVAGSCVEAIADVLKRYAGKANTDSLAGADGFRSAEGQAVPGLFGYSTPPALFAKFDAAKKAAGRTVDPDAIAWARFVVNPKAVRRVTGNLHLQADAIGLTAAAECEPGVRSPLLDLLAGAVPAAGPRVVADDAPWGFTVALPRGERRAAGVLAFADAVAKANGAVGRLPSEAAKDAGFDVKADLLDAAAAVTVFFPPKQSLPSGVPPWPAVVVHTVDDAAAVKWEQSVPKLVQWLGGADAAPVPSSETVAGVKVQTVPGAGLPWNAAVHYVRGGGAVVLALDREAAAAAAVQAGQRPAAAPGPEAVALGVVRPAGLSAQFFPTPPTPKPATPATGRPGELPVPGLPHPVPSGGHPPRSEPITVGLGRSAKHLPEMTVTVTRSAGRVTLEAWQRDLAKPLGLAVKDVMLWFETRPETGEQNGPQVLTDFLAIPGR